VAILDGVLAEKLGVPNLLTLRAMDGEFSTLDGPGVGTRARLGVAQVGGGMFSLSALLLIVVKSSSAGAFLFFPCFLGVFS
jgi:hypothetical protein